MVWEMKRNSVLDNQSVKRQRRKRGSLQLRRFFGQLGFGLIKIFLFFLGIGSVSLAFLVGYQLFDSSPYFRLTNIVVAGVHDTFKEELIKLAGIKGNENLVFVESSQVRRKIEKHPLIKSACVKKEYPHTLHIKAENEEAVAIVISGTMSFMNREGIIFKDVEDNDCIDFPVITGLSECNEKNRVVLRGVASFLNTLYSYGNALLARDLSEIHIEEDGTFVIYFNKLSFKVLFGREDFRRKIDALEKIISHLKNMDHLDQVRSMDFDYKDRVVVAFKEKVI